MRLSVESNKNESTLFINITEREFDRARKISDKLVEFGYCLCHYDSEVYMLTGDPDLTIKSMREDYRDAKKLF